MKELVEYIARGLVEEPDQVRVTESGGGARRVVNLRVAPADMGKVIGKQGHIAQAIRTLLKVAAAREGSNAQPVLVINAAGDGQSAPLAVEDEAEIPEET